jgi:hypothetical protein
VLEALHSERGRIGFLDAARRCALAPQERAKIVFVVTDTPRDGESGGIPTAVEEAAVAAATRRELP